MSRWNHQSIENSTFETQEEVATKHINIIIEKDFLAFFEHRIYISILIMSGLTSMFEYLCRNWKGGNGAYQKIQESGE
jgi:hypothetical protein